MILAPPPRGLKLPIQNNWYLRPLLWPYGPKSPSPGAPAEGGARLGRLVSFRMPRAGASHTNSSLVSPPPPRASLDPQNPGQSPGDRFAIQQFGEVKTRAPLLGRYTFGHFAMAQPN